MQEPSILFENEFSRNSQWKCFQHGDSWPNNFIFYNNVINNNQEAFIIDWQVRVCVCVYEMCNHNFIQKKMVEFNSIQFNCEI